jgi:hypothetical protein
MTACDFPTTITPRTQPECSQAPEDALIVLSASHLPAGVSFAGKPARTAGAGDGPAPSGETPLP